MAKYRKKPVVIEAFQWMQDKAPQWWIDASASFSLNLNDGTVYIPTPEGTMSAQQMDWIIKGVNNEIYPCKPDIFIKTYELLDEPKPRKEEERDSNGQTFDQWADDNFCR